MIMQFLKYHSMPNKMLNVLVEDFNTFIMVIPLKIHSFLSFNFFPNMLYTSIVPFHLERIDWAPFLCRTVCFVYSLPSEFGKQRVPVRLFLLSLWMKKCS